MAQLQPELQPNKIKINVQNGNGAGGRRVGAGQDMRKEETSKTEAQTQDDSEHIITSRLMSSGD